MKIVVLAGGLSDERNVSLSSGCKVCAALRERGHQAALIDMYLGTDQPSEALFSAPIPEELTKIGRQAPDLAAVRAARTDGGENRFGPGVLEACRLADVVFLGLHGTCGEDGRVQAALDLLGIPYTGAGYLGSAIAMDKDLTKRLAAPLGVATPKWELVRYTAEEIPALTARLEVPCVVKPVASGSSIGVSVVHGRDALSAALTQCLDYGRVCVVEQYIAGREIQVGILEDRALPSIEIVPKEGFYDYENKYQPGAAEEFCPAPIPEEWEARLGKAALTVFHALGLSVYSRADFIVTEDGTPWFLEINTLPGMTPTSLLPQEAAAVGIGYGELCERIINASLEARRAGK
ncbi:MAG: D-alanine--D-alanine ligase [Oscillospiraceae bacterium]|jgi:D-alanine-D-alanine ligase|nr:D-alanine--D-alanine ligase [Oscillospiraceae bacterium]